MLVDRLERFDVPVWLVNTGWTGGPYGTGERMNIDHTRNMVRAAINGELDGVATVEDPIFRVAVPVSVPGVPDEVLQSRARRGPTRSPTTRRPGKLATMFHENFARYADGVSEAVRARRPDRGPRGPRRHQDVRPGRGLTGALHATGN